MTKNIAEKRNVRLEIRLTESEKLKLFEQLIDLNFNSISELARYKFFENLTKKQLEARDFRQVYAQLKHLNNNLNQSTKALNTIAKTADKSTFRFDLLEQHLLAVAQAARAIERELLK